MKLQQTMQSPYSAGILTGSLTNTDIQTLRTETSIEQSVMHPQAVSSAWSAASSLPDSFVSFVISPGSPLLQSTRIHPTKMYERYPCEPDDDGMRSLCSPAFLQPATRIARIASISPVHKSQTRQMRGRDTIVNRRVRHASGTIVSCL